MEEIGNSITINLHRSDGTIATKGSNDWTDEC